MIEEGELFSLDKIEELDQQFRYMVYGQGFSLCVVDTKHTRRRTLVNGLDKAGVETLFDATGYLNALEVMREKVESDVIILTDLELDKNHGLKLVTDSLQKYSGCGIIITDKKNLKLEAVAAASESIAVLIRPVTSEIIVETIRALGYKI